MALSVDKDVYYSAKRWDDGLYNRFSFLHIGQQQLTTPNPRQGARETKHTFPDHPAYAEKRACRRLRDKLVTPNMNNIYIRDNTLLAKLCPSMLSNRSALNRARFQTEIRPHVRKDGPVDALGQPIIPSSATSSLHLNPTFNHLISQHCTTKVYSTTDLHQHIKHTANLNFNKNLKLSSDKAVESAVAELQERISHKRLSSPLLGVFQSKRRAVNDSLLNIAPKHSLKKSIELDQLSKPTNLSCKSHDQPKPSQMDRSGDTQPIHKVESDNFGEDDNQTGKSFCKRSQKVVGILKGISKNSDRDVMGDVKADMKSTVVATKKHDIMSLVRHKKSKRKRFIRSKGNSKARHISRKRYTHRRRCKRTRSGRNFSIKRLSNRPRSQTAHRSSVKKTFVQLAKSNDRRSKQKPPIVNGVINFKLGLNKHAHMCPNKSAISHKNRKSSSQSKRKGKLASKVSRISASPQKYLKATNSKRTMKDVKSRQKMAKPTKRRR